ncbi:Histone chaperone asf1 [Entomortierella chlamydospora]|uniref:Anti-silencing function protein 1 n=1 Tax=Entomortierella chlamydospora TaxID=101097 RepID=A0A9P6N248_9FUNG|nr:Histone chaperone asf1 [Entomortierella chlamydospora]KAG0022059.1 Histone chaperone asf1 [Entomortierella chlamydospora]
MSIVSITQINVLDNPTHFANPYQFEITFECIAPLAADLEWKIIYVGSANSNAHDQVLESIMVGPVPVGVNKFVFQADAPKPELIPHNDIVGVTVILITCSYQDREFVRIGYYVNNDYLEEELRENPPEQIAYEKLYRSILAEKPRVTRFPINWDNPMEEEQPPLQTEEQIEEMEAATKAQLEGGEWEDMES